MMISKFGSSPLPGGLHLQVKQLLVFWGVSILILEDVLLRGGFKHFFLPLLGEMIQFDSYFQMGWNHQLDKDYPPWN